MRFLVMATLCSFLLASPMLAQPPKKSNPKSWEPVPKDFPARLKPIVSDLRAIFNTIDADRDWELNERELARFFRGEKATVPDWANGSSDSKRPNLDEIKAKFPDQYFITAYDLNRDGKIDKNEYVTEFAIPVIQHFDELYKKLDVINKINLQLQVKSIDRAQRAKLAADMRIMQANLNAGIAAFKHGLALERMAAASTIRKTEWAWYRQFKK